MNDLIYVARDGTKLHIENETRGGAVCWSSTFCGLWFMWGRYGLTRFFTRPGMPTLCKTCRKAAEAQALTEKGSRDG